LQDFRASSCGKDVEHRRHIEVLGCPSAFELEPEADEETPDREQDEHSTPRMMPAATR
jgi:hypothetical protein